DSGVDMATTGPRYPMRCAVATALLEQIELGGARDLVDRRHVSGRTVDAELDLDVALGQAVDDVRAVPTRDRREAQRVTVVAAVELDVEVGVGGARDGVGRGAVHRPLDGDRADARTRHALAALGADFISALRIAGALAAAGGQ